MQAAPLVLVSLLGALALAGCATKGPAPQPDTVYVTIAHPVNASTWQPCLGFVGDADLTGLGVQPPSGRFTSASAFDAGAHLVVSENVSSLVLDLWWDHGVATAVRSEATAPDGGVTLSQPYTSSTAKEPIRLRFDHPAPGEWEWKGVANPAAAGVILHFNEGMYFETPESLAFQCNTAHAANGA